ncbi:hypothetical protein V2J09_021107 [Rumex salicifolius]
MPGIPLAARETNQSANLDQMRHQDTQVHLSAEEEIAAEQGLTAYCKPVEFYNILQLRANRNPLFLQRCLRYKIEAKHCKRLKVTISLSDISHDGLPIQSLFPLHVMLARRVPDPLTTEYPAVFRYSKVHILRSSSMIERKTSQTSFILPEMDRLAKEAKSGVHYMLFISYAKTEKCCLWGKISLESLLLPWEKSLNLKLGGRAEMMLTLHLHPYLLKSGCYNNEKCLSFQPSVGTTNLLNMKQVQMFISAEELGAKEKSSYNSYTYNNVPMASSSHMMRLRSGNVLFNYKYCGNKLQKTEVTEDFVCPFCLVGAHPRVRRKPRNRYQNSKYVYPLAFASNTPGETSELFDKADDAQSSKNNMARSSSVNGSHTALTDPEVLPSGGNLAPPPVLQFAKTRKLSIEHSDHRNRALLEKRQFFHSHRSQPMILEQVLSDHDSEDEVDDDVADLEDRRMLDDFIDVSKDEKQIMHLWNSFVRKQRVLADSHIPWACEAFSRLHGHDLVQAPSLVLEVIYGQTVEPWTN